MSSTLAAYVADLAALTVTGVTRSYSAPPVQINTADLPCMYPRLPQLADNPVTACGQGGWPIHTAELVIMVEPLGQNLQPTNFAAVLALIDALQAALQHTPSAQNPLWQSAAPTQGAPSDSGGGVYSSAFAVGPPVTSTLPFASTVAACW